jgi:GNAT superfamily N-acetyltransferase
VTVPTVIALPRLPTPPDTRAHLTARPILNLADVLLMGAIRHRQRSGFSADNSPIDDRRQEDWWKHHHHRVEAWLFDDRDGNTVGYAALLQRPDGAWVSSCAVLPEYTGHGHGKAILTWMIMQVDHEVYARARTDNPAAMKLHDPLLWEVTGVDQEGQNVYYRTWPRIRRARMAVNLDHCGVLGQ